MAIPTSYYPPVGFHFLVEFGLTGSAAAEVAFQEVSGLSRELTVETIAGGGENRFSHKLPTRASYPNLVLKRGLLLDSALRAWCDAAMQDLAIEPVDAWVKVLNAEHQPLQTYALTNVWPVKWSLSDLDAMDGKLLIETLELAYSQFKIVA